MTVPQLLCSPPRSAPQLGPYWEGIARHALLLPRCSACGRWEWYPSPGGPACPGGRYDWRPISAGATVFTFTRVERPLLPSTTEPYVVGLVCPDDAPDCRIVTRLESAPGELRIGARARLEFAGDGERSFPYYIVERST